MHQCITLLELPSFIGVRVLRAKDIPRSNYLCRVGMPGEYFSALSRFDAQINQSFAHLIGADPTHASDASSDQSRARAARPLRHAGMALCKASSVSPFAFFGAIANASSAILAARPTGLPRRFSSAIRASFRTVYDRIDKRLRDTHFSPEGSDAMTILKFYGTLANSHSISNGRCYTLPISSKPLLPSEMPRSLRLPKSSATGQNGPRFGSQALWGILGCLTRHIRKQPGCAAAFLPQRTCPASAGVALISAKIAGTA